MTLAVIPLSAAEKTFVIGKSRYVVVEGAFTHAEAIAKAAQRGGHPVVFENMAEHTAVIAALGGPPKTPLHTGHYQLATGREPQMGWTTVNGQKSANIRKLFNSSGPDDGIGGFNWGFLVNSDGTGEVFYGAGTGKDEDCGVCWYDADGRLEDVSIRARYPVLVEIPLK
ncbi:MAG: hypothetical protein QM811_26265 [Pirellulales bacterium]